METTKQCLEIIAKHKLFSLEDITFAIVHSDITTTVDGKLHVVLSDNVGTISVPLLEKVDLTVKGYRPEVNQGPIFSIDGVRRLHYGEFFMDSTTPEDEVVARYIMDMYNEIKKLIDIEGPIEAIGESSDRCALMHDLISLKAKTEKKFIMDAMEYGLDSILQWAIDNQSPFSDECRAYFLRQPVE